MPTVIALVSPNNMAFSPLIDTMESNTPTANIGIIIASCPRVTSPNELKMKYLADNNFANLSGKELQDAIKAEILKKDGSSLVGNMAAQGTTPRRLTDLIGSLCDLTSGSGDKGTPIVYIQGYFDNYTTE